MNDLFYNPYHFVPVDDKDEKDFWEDKETFFDGVHSPGHWSHQRYATKSDIYHGRILCKLTTETPLFVGAKRTRKGTEETSGEVAPYELKGDPAIPASSLRGVISSIAEAASNSALRVLENKLLSRRMEMKKESLQAIGLLLPYKNKKLKLLPLALPPFKCDENGNLLNQVEKKWRSIFKYPGMKVYIKGYRSDSNGVPHYLEGSFIEKIKPKSFSSVNKELWFLKLGRIKWDKGYLTVDNPYIKTIKGKREPTHYLLGQKSMEKNGRPISEKEFKKLSPKDKKDFICGILRVLGIDDRQSDIPGTKKHEIFIPLTPEVQRNELLDVAQALDKFNALSDQRTELDCRLPFELKGMKREKKDGKIRLKAFDIVFFDIHEVDKKIVVKEVSLSSIWRKDAGGTIFDYFSPEIKHNDKKDKDKEYLPFHPEREKISPAEMVFGFVEELEKKPDTVEDKNVLQALAYAGRVRFSHGIWQPKDDQKPYSPAVTLKILDTPKPPSPALYFTMRNGRPKYIPKDKLNLEKYKPQGRKFYLHHRKPETDAECWKTYFDENFKYKNDEDRQNRGRFKQKVKIKPLKANLNFLFHVDFENLNDFELGMLCYALRPNGRFRHKIGMGKPLGLGTVRIDPLSICYIDRAKRYRKADLFNSSRYHDIWRADEPSSSESNLPKDKDKKRSFSDFRDYFRNIMKNINAKGIEALELIGDPAGIKDAPVQYPQVNMAKVEKGDDELEHFRWWEANKKFKKFLAPIDESGRLTKLPKHKFKKKDKD
jgi:CRISPR-associated protein (TIGR03986 family)